MINSRAFSGRARPRGRGCPGGRYVYNNHQKGHSYPVLLTKRLTKKDKNTRENQWGKPILAVAPAPQELIDWERHV